MHTVTLSKKSIELPRTAEEWELYTGKPKAKAAARALTAALTKVVRLMAKGRVVDWNAIHALLGEHFTPVREQFADEGAADTEPRELAYAVVARVRDAIA